MKLPKLKKGDMVVVQWDDTQTEPGWMDESAISKFHPRHSNTIGFFHSADKIEIKLNHSVCEDGDKDCTTIPIGCITSINKLKFE